MTSSKHTYTSYFYIISLLTPKRVFSNSSTSVWQWCSFGRSNDTMVKFTTEGLLGDLSLFLFNTHNIYLFLFNTRLPSEDIALPVPFTTTTVFSFDATVSVSTTTKTFLTFWFSIYWFDCPFQLLSLTTIVPINRYSDISKPRIKMLRMLQW